MAVQGRRSRRKPHGASRIPQGDQDILSTRNFVHGVDESTFGRLHIQHSSPDRSIDERGGRD